MFGVLVQAIVLFGVLHRATLATSAAAVSTGGRSSSPTRTGEAAARGSLVVEQAARNHGLPAGALHATVDGGAPAASCSSVHVRTEVPVFRLPFVGSVWPSVSVPVEATHAVRIDRYRSGP